MNREHSPVTPSEKLKRAALVLAKIEFLLDEYKHPQGLALDIIQTISGHGVSQMAMMNIVNLAMDDLHKQIGELNQELYELGYAAFQLGPGIWRRAKGSRCHIQAA